MAKEPENERATRIHKGEGFRTIYVNSVNIERSSWDVRIRLGQIQTATEKELEIEELAHVYMSPQHAKAFADILNKSVRQWEAGHGDVSMPPSKGAENKGE